MRTGRKVSFHSLRILTYTVLIKAVIDAVIIISSLIAAEPVHMAAQAMGFINIVACVMCLSGITALSGRFVSVHRIMVAVLIMECLLLFLSETGILLAFRNGDTAEGFMEFIVPASIAAIRLLIGAAFLLLMTGFADILRKRGELSSAEASRRLGIIYLCFSCIHTILGSYAVTADGNHAASVVTAFGFMGVALEIIMYRRVSEAAFLLWRDRAGTVSEEEVQWT